jgi:hypothetical protein
LELFAPEAHQRSALNNVFNKQSWLAAIGGTAIGAVTLYVLQLAPPPNALLSFPLAGVAAVACRLALRQGVSMAAGALLGLKTGILMSVLVVIWTIIVTGVDHYEFAFALFFMPFLICILCVLSAWATAFFVRLSA